VKVGLLHQAKNIDLGLFENKMLRGGLIWNSEEGSTLKREKISLSEAS
jgi:hypothetical protein